MLKMFTLFLRNQLFLDWRWEEGVQLPRVSLTNPRFCHYWKIIIELNYLSPSLVKKILFTTSTGKAYAGSTGFSPGYSRSESPARKNTT